jgi:hypothetical protein
MHFCFNVGKKQGFIIRESGFGVKSKVETWDSPLNVIGIKPSWNCGDFLQEILFVVEKRNLYHSGTGQDSNLVVCTHIGFYRVRDGVHNHGRDIGFKPIYC